MPTILFLFGLRFFFYSDEHLPMHVHVKNGDGKAKAVDAVKQYKADMIREWKAYFGDED